MIIRIQKIAAKRFVKDKIRKEPDVCKAVNELFADEIKDLKAIVADKDSIISKLQAENSALIARLNAKTGKKSGKKSTVK